MTQAGQVMDLESSRLPNYAFVYPNALGELEVMEFVPVWGKHRPNCGALDLKLVPLMQYLNVFKNTTAASTVQQNCKVPPRKKVPKDKLRTERLLAQPKVMKNYGTIRLGLKTKHVRGLCVYVCVPVCSIQSFKLPRRVHCDDESQH